MVQQVAAPVDRVVGPVAGLRQRKKQRTRCQLLEAAQKLFLRQGYARTTVDEITAAVDVSQRTFFRYFANKEQVALALMEDGADDFVDYLRSRPSHENPLQALRAATRETWESRDISEPGASPATAALEIFQLIECTPTLLAAYLHRLAEQQQLIAEVLAEREGVDPAVDLRPRVLAAVFSAVGRTAQHEWAAGVADRGVDVEDLVQVLDRHFDQLGPALTADWR
ncbi:TetR family transcriptional regulator [Streptacidiphilus sp. N1-10]|uniref:TetR family transcriptional regulator n=1 Tax=Streptacidiphilus jeojiensis TaxID=3229225 RepID=A0ABV6XR19_9ACTN